MNLRPPILATHIQGMDKRKLIPARWRVRKRETKAPEAPPQTAERGAEQKPREVGGPAGPEPTRYGDWERKGRCVDF